MSNCGTISGYPCSSGPCIKNSLFILQTTMKKINKQVGMSSSQMIDRKKSSNVTKWLAQGETAQPPSSALSFNAGGVGDYIQSIQRSTRAGIRGNKARIEKAGAKGVDKKHSSYARYLARKTGKVLRQETPNECCLQAPNRDSDGRLPTVA